MSLFRSIKSESKACVFGLLVGLVFSSGEAGCICTQGLPQLLVGNSPDLSYAILGSSYGCLQGQSMSS